jgi:hypothetical protein
LSDDGSYSDGHVKLYDSSVAPFDNTWHHVAFTFDGSESALKIYIDGQEDTSPDKVADDAITSLYVSNANVFIGARYLSSSPGNFFNGLIDDVMIFNRTLTATEIGQIYNSTYSRFHSQGNQTFQYQNFTQDGTLNKVNVTIEAQLLNGSTISGILYESDDNSSWTESLSGEQSFESLDGDYYNATFDILKSTNYTRLKLLYYSGDYGFYSPILMNDITFDLFNVVEDTICDCPSGNWEINDGTICNLATVCNIPTYNLRIGDGGLRINDGGSLTVNGIYVADSQVFYVDDNAQLYIED